MASTNYETNTKFADMTASDHEEKKLETPYMDHNMRQGTNDANSKDGEGGQEWTGRK